MRWTAQEPNRIFAAIMQLNQAENYDEFREALRYYDVPSQNVVYADVEGNIAYMMPGRVPIRENGDGLKPVPGWTGEYEWEGFIPFEELPVVLNPEKGFIVTANNAVVEPAYPYLINHYYAAGDRAQRISDMLGAAIAAAPVTMEDFRQIQMDDRVLLAEAYVPLLNGLTSSDAQVQAAIERLRGWDFRARSESVPATIFEIFYMQLTDTVLRDELGEIAGEINGSSPSHAFFYDLAGKPEAVWWDNVETDQVETQQQTILQALAKSVTWLEEQMGTDMEAWQWGQLHTVTFVSNPLGQSGIAPVEWLVNEGPFPVAGSSRTVNANSWSWENPAEVRGHPSMRMIVDLSDLDATTGVQPTGQSGHPFHRHYDDMIELWRTGEYHPMWFSREAIEEATVDHLVLKPPAE
jgi:penicillin amidase